MLNLGDEETSVIPPNTQDNFSRKRFRRKSKNRSFKLIKGRNGPTAFLSLSPKLGGQVNTNRPNVGQYLTSKKANFVYKKTESGEMINTKTLQQELKHERQLKMIDVTSGDKNPYKEVIVKNAEKIEPLLAQMEQ